MTGRESPVPRGTAYALSAGEGEAIWFAGALMIIKDKDAGRVPAPGFAFIDQRTPGNYAVPRHVHEREDEAWYVLEGDVTFFCGDEALSAGPGTYVFAPKGLPHAFRVGPAGARLLTLACPAGFADFVRAAGVPAPSLTLPPEAPLDAERLAEVARAYGIAITGPPPA